MRKMLVCAITTMTVIGSVQATQDPMAAIQAILNQAAQAKEDALKKQHEEKIQVIQSEHEAEMTAVRKEMDVIRMSSERATKHKDEQCEALAQRNRELETCVEQVRAAVIKVQPSSSANTESTNVTVEISASEYPQLGTAQEFLISNLGKIQFKVGGKQELEQAIQTGEFNERAVVSLLEVAAMFKRATTSSESAPTIPSQPEPTGTVIRISSSNVAALGDDIGLDPFSIENAGMTEEQKNSMHAARQHRVFDREAIVATLQLVTQQATGG